MTAAPSAPLRYAGGARSAVPPEAGSQGADAPPLQLVQHRLPRPVRRARRQTEVRLRTASPADAGACASLDGMYSTTHVWQLDTRQEGDELRLLFRQVRLPRELVLLTAHQPPAVRSAGRRDLLWLVAEEVEVERSGSPSTAAARPEVSGVTPAAVPAVAPVVDGRARAPWSHTLRPTGGRSALQLGLPADSLRDVGSDGVFGRPDLSSARAETSESPRPTQAHAAVVGYVVAASPGDGSAYLRTLLVDRQRRRGGIGTRLLAAARQWAAARGADRLIADVPARNYPALHLLQKAGFAFCGYNERCYVSNEVALFFAARLP